MTWFIQGDLDYCNTHFIWISGMYISLIINVDGNILHRMEKARFLTIHKIFYYIA